MIWEVQLGKVFLKLEFATELELEKYELTFEASTLGVQIVKYGI